MWQRWWRAQRRRDTKPFDTRQSRDGAEERDRTHREYVADHQRLEVDTLRAWKAFPSGDSEVLFVDHGRDLCGVCLAPRLS